MPTPSVCGSLAVGLALAFAATSPGMSVVNFLHTMITPYLVRGLVKAHVKVQLASDCECPVGAKTASLARFRKDAVAILAQRDRMPVLNESLRLFYRNFNRCFRKDVLIFHNGDFTEEDERQMQKQLGPEIQLRELTPGGQWWDVPESVQRQFHKFDGGHWPMGFFHMTRWYGVLIYEYLAEMGYEFFMRLDDDSYILSCINYDLFHFMDQRNLSYGYRLEHVDSAMGPFTVIMNRSLQAWGVPPPPRLLARFKDRKLHWRNWDGRHFYNNFCITRVSFWRSPAVMHMLHALEDSGLQYTSRVLDAPLQTMIVVLLMPEQQIFRFRDWSYTHHPKIVVTLSTYLPTSVASAVFRLGVPNYEWVAGLPTGKEINFFLDFQKVFGRGNKWYGALRR